MALEPMGSADGELVEPLAQDEMICPKCELRQARADQCGGCGVFMHKVMPKAAESEAADQAVSAAQPREAVSVASSAAIGGDIKLKQHGGLDELALESVVSADGELVEPLVQDEMICPKCELRQARADECACCGVFVHKVLP
jgi:methionyl-tRNA synthetase